MTETTKRCPGFAPSGQEPHELPATLEFFGRSASNKDGLTTRCKVDGNAYGKAWAEAKRKGEPFTVKPAKAAAVSPLRAPEPEQQIQVAEREAAALEPTYADPLAEQASKGQAPGYTAELVGSAIYALPGAEAAETPEGQVALQAVNAARDAERRRRGAERKRLERAAAKQRAAATA